jgi:enoyl-CoA hydratase/carnithine racemase
MMANSDKSFENVKLFVKLCARLYIFPVPTVCAINGHAFAGGFMLALSHDFRYMRKKKGLFCLPEIDLPLPLPPSMTSIIRTRCTPEVYGEIIFGKRFSPEEGEKFRIIHQATEPDDLMVIAMCKAKEIAKKDKNRENLQKIKYIAYKEVFDNCMLPIEEL